MPSAPGASPKGSEGQGKERGSAVVSCLTLLRIGYGEGIQGGLHKALGPLGDIVSGGCGPEWAKSISEVEQDSQGEGQERRKSEHKGFLTTCCCYDRSYLGSVEYYN